MNGALEAYGREIDAMIVRDRSPKKAATHLTVLGQPELEELAGWAESAGLYALDEFVAAELEHRELEAERAGERVAR